MDSLTISEIDEPLKTGLQARAATNGRSIEAEARDILRAAVNPAPAVPGNLYDAISARFAKYGGVDLELPARDEFPRDPPTFD